MIAGVVAPAARVVAARLVGGRRRASTRQADVGVEAVRDRERASRRGVQDRKHRLRAERERGPDDADDAASLDVGPRVRHAQLRAREAARALGVVARLEPDREPARAPLTLLERELDGRAHLRMGLRAESLAGRAGARRGGRGARPDRSGRAEQRDVGSAPETPGAARGGSMRRTRPLRTEVQTAVPPTASAAGSYPSSTVVISPSRGSMRTRVPSRFAVQTAPAPAARSTGARSTPSGTVAATAFIAGSILVTVALVAFRTQTPPEPIATRVGKGASASPRPEIGTRARTLSLRGSTSTATALGPLTAQTAAGVAATSSMPTPTSTAALRPVRASTRSSRVEPSATQTAFPRDRDRRQRRRRPLHRRAAVLRQPDPPDDLTVGGSRRRRARGRCGRRSRRRRVRSRCRPPRCRARRRDARHGCARR